MWSDRKSGAGRAAAFIAVVMLLLPLGAWGEDSLDTVREANQRYDGGAFVEALRLYRVAYDQMSDARLLYRIGLTYEHIGNYQRAREVLEHYLREDPESPVRGRVEANILSLQRLEENIQSYLRVETEPAGAEVFLHGYFGKSEGLTPVTIPVGAGENVVTLLFPEGQRLEVPVEVRAGGTEERFFQIGTAARPSDEVASVETPPVEASPEIVVEEERSEEGEVQAEWGEEEGEREEQPVAQTEDVIPMPGSEPEQTRTIQLDHVDLGPPRVVLVSSVALITLGNLLLASGVITSIGQASGGEDFDDLSAGGFYVGGAVLTAGGIFLMGRKWRGRLPSAQAGLVVPAEMGRAAVVSRPVSRPTMFQLSVGF